MPHSKYQKVSVIWVHHIRRKTILHEKLQLRYQCTLSQNRGDMIFLILSDLQSEVGLKQEEVESYGDPRKLKIASCCELDATKTTNRAAAYIVVIMFHY